MGKKKYFAAAAIAAAVLLWMALAVFGGPLNRFDHATIDALAVERATYPFLTHAGIWISRAGGAPTTIGLSVIGAAFLVWRRHLVQAGVLLMIVLSGRLMVDILKLSIGRPRPDLDLHAITVQSLSFPSGHAANSMIGSVAVALFCAPERYRRAALTLAISASVLIGTTRPLLGVHWPSDVLAGWIFGLLWAVGWWQIAGKFGAAKPA